jgi:hypothetical protein
VLRAVGAGEHRRLRDNDARFVLQRVPHRGDVDVVGDVAAAVANINADLSLCAGSRGLAMRGSRFWDEIFNDIIIFGRLKSLFYTN